MNQRQEAQVKSSSDNQLLGKQRAERQDSQSADGLSDSLQLEREQQAILETTPVEQSYQQVLATYVQAKHAQVERIEDKIESLIEQQQARLQQSRTQQPGVFSRPSVKTAWQSRYQQEQSRLQGLQGRLEVVREIKDGMGINSPRIEELASRKLRNNDPSLAADFDSTQEARRRHQAMLRKKGLDKERAQRQQVGQRLGLTQRQSPAL